MRQHGTVHVAARDRVANSHQLKHAGCVANQLLRSAFHKCAVVDRAEVARLWFQIEIQLSERLRAMVNDDVIDVAYCSMCRVIAADLNTQTACLWSHREQPLAQG